MERLLELGSALPERLASLRHFFKHNWEQWNWGWFKTLLPDWDTHHYLGLLFVIGLFWPIVVTLVMALTAISAWLFWLLTSIIFGVLQLVYVTYQFAMISLNLVGLTFLKAYSMLRSQIRQHFTFSERSSEKQKRSSQRREWKRRLDEAGSYENFLKIAIEEKQPIRTSSSDDDGKDKKQTSSPQATKSSSSSPPRRLPGRSASFGNILEATTGPFLTRNKSFDQKSAPPVLIPEEEHKSRIEQELGMMGGMLLATTLRLREARLQASQEGTEDAVSSLKYLLSGVVKRNHLSVDDLLIDDAGSVAESGQHGISREGRKVIHGYHEEVEKCLDWIAEAPLQTKDGASSATKKKGGLDTIDGAPLHRHGEIFDRMTLVRKMKQNMGRTALMLSGGGAQAMYHIGTVRALVESQHYKDISVISGTSGGSITAAMCAIKTPEELYTDVCVTTVSTDYMLTGEQKKRNIRWFPTLTDMGAHWLKHKVLLDSAEFKRCCDFYYGDMTFEEAFERTGKHVCITVSASRVTGSSAQRLLLNHISTPHVTLASAVAASCALPGVMIPAKLTAKDSNGRQEPFEVDGVEWIDGSVQADLPFQRISTLFNVSNYVVGQTNFHVIPLLNKAHHPSRRSLYWRLFQTCEWDIRNRALKLSRLGLFPRIFGQDISKVFKQKYHGNLTLVPRFTTMQTFGLKMLVNPTVKDMEGYLKYGQIAAWPYLNVIQDMLRIEKALDHCLSTLEERCRMMSLDMDGSHHGDGVDSIASSMRDIPSHRVRFAVEDTRLKEEVISLERENQSLRQQLKQMQRLLAERRLSDNDNGDGHEESGVHSPTSENGSAEIRLSEKDVWGQIRRMRT